MESDKERWFPGVAVDNCIVVLEKCSGVEKAIERGSHTVRFVKFHKPLIPTFVTAASDDEDSQRKRFGYLKRLVSLIENCDEFQDNEEVRIYPKQQAELIKEGIAESADEEKSTYVGSRWGRFTTAHQFSTNLLSNWGRSLSP